MADPFIGEIRMFAGNFAPRNWALCDGTLMSVSQNTALFSLVGTIYGGDGRSTFGLPDLRGRLPMHPGTGPGLTTRRLGEKSGSETVVLTESEMAGHGHQMRAYAGAGDSDEPQGNSLAQSTFSIDVSNLTALHASSMTPVGGGGGHNNVQPSLCLNFIIALLGTYPSRS